MYKPIVTRLAILATAATLYAGSATADEPSPYALKTDSNSKKAVPTLVQRLMKQYCSAHKDEPVCQTKKSTSPFGAITPEEALGLHTKK